MNYSQKMSDDGFVSASPLPSVEELSKFYAEMYYQNPQSSSYQVSYPDWEIRHKRHKADILMKVLESAAGRPIRKATDRYVDIGCGEGFVLKAASERGMSVKGFDFSEFGIRKFHPELLPFFESGDAMGILQKLGSAGERYDFCSTVNVMEHVVDPVVFLGLAQRIVADDGIFAVTVPNDFSRLQKRLRELGQLDRDFWFCPPHHLHYFNTENLLPFLEKHGFEMVDMYSDFPVDLFLFHPGSNYIADSKNGPAAHRARVEADLLLAESGDGPYLDLCRAMARCGLGRDITAVVRRKG